jgi:hypothetical protein
MGVGTGMIIGLQTDTHESALCNWSIEMLLSKDKFITAALYFTPVPFAKARTTESDFRNDERDGILIIDCQCGK